MALIFLNGQPINGQPQVVATHAALSSVNAASLSAGDVFRVSADGTEWTYTGDEPSAPDPSNVLAWDQTKAADVSFFNSQTATFTRKVYVDHTAGNDVFNDGLTTGTAWASYNRALAQVPNSTQLDFIDYIIKHVDTDTARADFGTNQAPTRFKFVTDTWGSLFIQIVARLDTPKDLDGLGATAFTPGTLTRDLTGPGDGGPGTIDKDHLARQATGLTAWGDNLNRNPATEGDVFYIYNEDFGLTGLEFWVGACVPRIHDIAELGTSDVPVLQSFNGGLSFFGSGGAGSPGVQIRALIDEVDASGSTTGGFDFPAGGSIEIIGFDFATDAVAQSTQNPFFAGAQPPQFRGCKFATGNQSGSTPQSITMRYPGPGFGGFAQTPFQGCVFNGIGGFNSDIRLIFSTTGVRVLENVFQNTGCLIGQGTAENECYANVFRGDTTPLGGNNIEWRLYIGGDDPTNQVGAPTFCARMTNEFERAPGDAGAMDGDAYYVNNSTISIGGSQGDSRIDVAGRFGVFGFKSFVSITDGLVEGEVGLPILFRYDSDMVPAVINGSQTTNTLKDDLNNVVTPGNDLQFGLIPTGGSFPDSPGSNIQSFPDSGSAGGPISDASRGDWGEKGSFR